MKDIKTKPKSITKSVQNAPKSVSRFPTDTVYQKGKSFAENKLKQHRQQVKTQESQNVDIPHTPQNEGVPKVQTML